MIAGSANADDDAAGALVARIGARPGTAVVLGGIDTGKTGLALRLLAAALEAGRSPVYVDLDVGQSTTGPATAIAWRRVASRSELDDLFEPDGLYFVGDIAATRQQAAVLAGAARALQQARELSDTIVVDTSEFVAGVQAQILKFHKLEVIAPTHVIGLHRGDELAPLLGVIRRFAAAEVSQLAVPAGVRAKSAEQRAERRRDGLARYFGGRLARYRVKAAALMPSLPPGVDPSALQGLLAGLEDGRGACVGIGMLEAVDGALHLAAPGDLAPAVLKLGSVAVDDQWRPRAVNLRALLGSA